MPPKLPKFKNLLRTLDNKLTIQKGFLTGKLKYGYPTEYTVWHQSFSPIKEFKVPFPERWDAATHGADPNLIWFTNSELPNTTGLLGERPFASQWRFTVQKPLIQTGEIKSLLGSKNNTRNAIIAFGKKNGADTFEFNSIADNRLPSTNVIAISESIEPNYVGGAGKIRFAGPTTGKSTFVKSHPETNYVDLDGIKEYKNIRQNVANQLGLDYTDPEVTNSKEYQQAFNTFVREWAQNKENLGKTLLGSSKALLRSDAPLIGLPFVPSRQVFIDRNHARGFKETDEQLQNWYNTLLESYPNMKIDNRFISDIPFKEYVAPKTKIISLFPSKSFTSVGPEWEGLEFPELTMYHIGLDGQRAIEPPKFKRVLGGAGAPYPNWENPKPIKYKMTPNEARHNNLEKLLQKFNGDKDAMWNWLNRKK